MNTDGLSLPDDVEQLKAMIAQRDATIVRHEAMLAQNDAVIASQHEMIEQSSWPSWSVCISNWLVCFVSVMVLRRNASIPIN